VKHRFHLIDGGADLTLFSFARVSLPPRRNPAAPEAEFWTDIEKPAAISSLRRKSFSG
jgi:hypothetical protein